MDRANDLIFGAGRHIIRGGRQRRTGNDRTGKDIGR